MKVNVISTTPTSSYDLCQGNHPTIDCVLMKNNEGVNYMKTKGNVYGNTYNPLWKNHPNFS